MLAGIVVIIIGFLLMMGGDSSDPNTFRPEEVYSFRRITLAPIVIVLGLLVDVSALLRRPKPNASWVFYKSIFTAMIAHRFFFHF